MKKLKTMVLISVFAVAGFWMQASYSEEIPEGEAEITVAKMGTKFCRGICNAATGWGEIFRQMILTAKDDDEGPLMMLPLGLSRGIFMTVVRTTTGVIETAFFYVPFNDSYDCFLDPAYVWQAAKGDNNEEMPPTKADHQAKP